ELGSGSFGGIHISEQAFTSLYGKADGRRFSIKDTPGMNATKVAHDIESSLLETGAQAESLRHKVDSESSTFTGFFRLMQGFMGLGCSSGWQRSALSPSGRSSSGASKSACCARSATRER